MYLVVPAINVLLHHQSRYLRNQIGSPRDLVMSHDKYLTAGWIRFLIHGTETLICRNLGSDAVKKQKLLCAVCCGAWVQCRCVPKYEVGSPL